MSRSHDRAESEGRKKDAGSDGARTQGRRNSGPGRSTGFWLAVGVTALTLGLRLAAALPITSSPMVMHPVLEDAAYHVRTLEVLRNEPPADGLPRGSLLYPRIASLAPGVLTEGSRALARAQSALEALTALFLFLWIRRRWGVWAGLAAGVLYALDPVGASFAARFSPVVPATLLFVASMWAWDTESSEGISAWPSTAVFTIATSLGFFLMPLPFALLVLLRIWAGISDWRKRDPGSRGMPWIRLFLAPGVVFLIAGLAMNRHGNLPGGGPVLGWGGGLAFSRAYDPATGGTQRGLTPPSWETRRVITERVWENLRREGTLYDLYRHYTSRGSRQAFSNPAATVGVILSKAAGTVGAFPIPDELSPSFLTRQQAPLFRYMDYSFALLLALAAAAFVSLRGQGTARVIGLGLLAVGVGSVLGTASAAARQPALPLLAAMAGIWLAGAGGIRRFRTRNAAVFPGVLALSILAGILSPASKLREPSEDLRLSALPFTQTLAWRQAVPLLESAVSSNPGNLEARVDLAIAYQMDALHSAAEEQLEAAHSADSTHARTLHELAKAKSARNQPIAAMSLYRELLRFRPNNAEFLNEYGRVLHSQGMMQEAEVAFSRALRLRPNLIAAQRSLQSIMAQKMQIEEALFPDELRSKADTEYLSVVPTIVQAMQEENWTLADSLLNWAEVERGEMAMTHWLRAGYHARRGDLDASIRELEICARIAPGRPAVVGQLTNLYFVTGRRNKVEPALRVAMEAAAGDSSRLAALEHLSRLAAARMAASTGN